ncbi:hypothetical protein PTSG_11708 [Salpingoeca rosetta]|uniref:Complex 1 LYR protein domain-containing protein n=1 Tax=Salpingoeca rosetta (strain ATCC 50818 / BSB-021) TaxID=946362 RepID=F2U013_SALR5|nr:uncharacterized protein PTSG_11708 [Salpingoeca rosetta]EGD80741.1 hypothetical protein PTSG_11708 [Salpingoeca rosetta]|eukprot:XP_004997302.1 hypothetical protein PTSG_11708 [Salpingoeca rosetta]
MRMMRTCLGMHPAVRELYKRYIFAGKDYPAGLDVVRRRVKQEFMANKDLKTEEEVLHAVARGRWYFNNEFVPAIKLRKYRDMKKRYYDNQ